MEYKRRKKKKRVSMLAYLKEKLRRAQKPEKKEYWGARYGAMKERARMKRKKISYKRPFARKRYY
jgi:hypothetical protein